MRYKLLVTATLLLPLTEPVQAQTETGITGAPDPQNQPPASQERSKFPPEYFVPHGLQNRRLQVGDEVEVSVFGNRDTVADNLPIAPDGKLYYMFLPGIQAEGRTATEIADEITSKLTNIFNNPEVSVIPKRFISNHFSILGKVANSGVYPLDTPTTVRQAIAKAGGIASGRYHDSTIQIHNYQDSWLLRGQEKIPINFTSLMNNNDFSEDIYLRPGDVIYIASSLDREVYLMGEVNQQQAQPFTAGMTLVQLISGLSSGSGGYIEDRADIKRVVILRDAMNDPKVFKINLEDILHGRGHDVFLEAGDIVYVPEKSFLFTRNLVKDMISTMVSTFASEFASDLNRKYLFEGKYIESRTRVQ